MTVKYYNHLMLKERDGGQLTNEVREFISSESVNVVIHPLADSKVEKEKINIIFCAASYVNDERGESLDFITFSKDGDHKSSNQFFREIFEWDYPHGQEVDNIDGWLSSAKEAFSDGKPFFSISFGVYEGSGARAVFIHAREGVTLNSAILTLKRFAEMNLFGKSIRFEE